MIRTHLLHIRKIKEQIASVWSVAHTPKALVSCSSKVFWGFGGGVTHLVFYLRNYLGEVMLKVGKWGWIWQVFSHDFNSTAQPEVFFSKSAKWVFSISVLLPIGLLKWKRTSINFCSILFGLIIECLTRNRRELCRLILFNIIQIHFLSKKGL